jgi:hypothetical protein
MFTLIFNRLFIILLALFVYMDTYTQDFGGDKVGIGNFVRRMYNTQPFNGVKILQTQEGIDYMVSVVELKKDPSKSESILSRIASVKAKAYASQYINGSNISTDVYVITTEEKAKDSVITKTTMQEVFKESSIGFVDGMELLTKFEALRDTVLVYVYFRIIK